MFTVNNSAVVLFVSLFVFVLFCRCCFFSFIPEKHVDIFLTSMTPASGKTNHNYFTHFVLIQQKHKCGGFLQVSQHQPTGKSLSIMTLHINFCYNPTETQMWRIFLQVSQHQPPGKSIHNDFTHFVIIPHKHKCGGFLQVSQHHPTGKSLSIMTLHIHFCYNPTETQVWRISTSMTTPAYRKVSTI